MSPTSVLSALCLVVAGLLAGWRIRRAQAGPATSAPGAPAASTVPSAPATPPDAPTLSDVRVALAFAAGAVATGVWMLVFPYTGDVASAAVCATVLATVALLTARRRRLARSLVAWWHDRRALRLALSPTQLLLALVAICGVCALELPWNTSFPAVSPHALPLELAFALFAVELAWGAGLGSAIGPTLVVAAMGTAGIMQAFVLDFRGTIVSIADLYAMGTAMAVRTGYAYRLSARMLWGISSGVVGGLACVLVAALRRDSLERPPARRLCLGWAVGMAALILGLLLPDYQDVFAIRVDYRTEWQLADHCRYLTLPSLVAEAQDLPIDRPSGYSQTAADAAEVRLGELWREGEGATEARAQAEETFRELQPSVVIVMNETFSDLTLFGSLNGYPGPTFFSRDLSDVLARGKLAVSVNGGGTCNSEFELLCGQSMAFVGGNKYPYTLYDLSEIPSLARQFSEMGYETCAIHPNLASNWHREEVYEQLGFERFLDIDAFEDASQFHNATSDAATYDAILDLLARRDAPQFVFDVTMQNHGGYDQGGVPDYLLRRYAAYGEGVFEAGLAEDADEAALLAAAEQDAQLVEYLACIAESDRALRSFVSRLRELDRPVVLVFFGDHQPAFSGDLNDALFGDEGPLTHKERIYQSDYLVWANYDVTGATDDAASGAGDAAGATDGAASGAGDAASGAGDAGAETPLNASSQGAELTTVAQNGNLGAETAPNVNVAGEASAFEGVSDGMGEEYASDAGEGGVAGEGENAVEGGSASAVAPAPRDVSASDLAATALALVGAPLTRQQEAQLGAQTLFSQLNLYGYRDLAGSWHDLPTIAALSDDATAIRYLRYLSYRDFGSRI